MNNSSFNWMWAQIDASIKTIEDSFTDTQKKQWNFRRTYGCQSKYIIFNEYNAIKDQLKSRCYLNQADPEIRIDHHKIAACFCLALLNKKLFAFDIDDNTPSEMLLSNYHLAYTVSLQIIYLYMIDAYSTSKDVKLNDIAQKLIDKGELEDPETTSTHDPYHLGRVKTLALNDFYHVDFDLLGYSGMMFWIEHYNRQLLERRIELDPLY